MTLRTVIFALLCVLVAFAYSGWEEVTHELKQGEKVGAIIAVSMFVILALSWVLYPTFVKYFM